MFYIQGFYKIKSISNYRIYKNEIKKYPLSGSLFKVKTNLKGKKAIFFKAANLLF